MMDTAVSPTPAPREGLSRLRRFGRDEDGSLIIFGLFIMVLMMMIGGFALDIERFETARTRLQNVSDGAALAAASLTQDVPAEDLVKDYFDKAGMKTFIDNIKVTSGLAYKRVEITSDITVPTHFGPLMGMHELGTIISSIAEESIGNVEISLVLDVSGSMNDHSRLVNLKAAAKEFVDTVYGVSTSHTVSTSIIPYATQVNAGAALLKHYNATAEHNYSHCVDFDASAFRTTELLTTTSLQRTGHFDPWTSYYYGQTPRSLVCRTGTGAEIMTLERDPAKVKTRIDALTAEGNTSTDIGVKWGAALLDPKTRPVVDAMIDDGKVNEFFRGRPADYNSSDSLKVLIVMTDGVHTAQYRLRPEYASGNSNVLYSPSKGKLYYKGVEVTEEDDKKKKKSDPVEPKTFYEPSADTWYNTSGMPGDQTYLTWPQLWNSMSVRYNAYNWYRSNDDANDYYLWDELPFTWTDSSTKNSNLSNICQATKSEGVVVFAIGLEVPGSAASLLRNCATTPAHYFDVDTTDISDAFAAIASDINRLRLVQ